MGTAVAVAGSLVGLGGGEVRVVIGKENKAEVIQDYSIVISRYGLPKEATGTIGVIGPTLLRATYGGWM